MKKLLRRLIPVAVSLSFLGVLYARTDWSTFAASMADIDLKWLLVMIPCTLATGVFRGIRWGVLSRWKSGGAGPVKALFISRAGNNLMPFRIGDLVRIQYAKDKGSVPYTASVSGVFLELVIDMGILSVMGIVFSLVTGSFPVIAVISAAVMLMLAAGLLYLHGRGTDGSSKPRGWLPSLLLRLTARLRGLTFSRSLVTGLLLSVPLWCMTLFSTYAGFRMLLPHVSMMGLFGGVVLIFLSATIPSAPGFIGTYHAAVGAAIILMGYDFAGYSALPVLLHGTQYIVQTVVGLAFGFSYIFRNNWSTARETILAVKRGGA